MHSQRAARSFGRGLEIRLKNDNRKQQNLLSRKYLKKKPRMVTTHYCHEDEESVHEPCLVQMFKQYISLVSELPKIDESFYF
jgi:hypothetical protein